MNREARTIHLAGFLALSGRLSRHLSLQCEFGIRIAFSRNRPTCDRVDGRAADHSDLPVSNWELDASRAGDRRLSLLSVFLDQPDRRRMPLDIRNAT